MIETTIKWHKATEELPEKSCYVLALGKNGMLLLINYSHEHKVFNAHDELKHLDYCFEPDEIEYWVKEDEVINQLNNISNIQPKINYQAVIALFHCICVSLPRVQKLTETRKKRIKATFTQLPDSSFEKFFKRVESSDFLTGRSGIWNGCCFDWILKPSNLTKIIEGNYDNKIVKPAKQVRQAKMEQNRSYDIDELNNRSFLDDLEV